MSTPYPAALLARLDEDMAQLDGLVADGQAEAASTLLAAHQSRLEDYLALPPGQRDDGALATLSRRHAELLASMGVVRDRAAERLRQYRANRHAAAAYQVSGRI